MSEEVVPKLGLWARQSKVTKGILIVTGLIIVIGGGYIIYDKFIRQPDVKKLPESEPETKIEDAIESKPEDKGKENTKEKKTDLYTLPNKGIGCSSIYDKHDGNYDYVKCNGIWYAKSKENPSNEATKGQYKDWASLELNDVQTKLLNTRYP